MKCSMGLRKDYPSFESFSKAIAEYIDYYNNSRIKVKTKWMYFSKFKGSIHNRSLIIQF